MQDTTRNTSAGLTVALAIGLAACGEGAAGEPQRASTAGAAVTSEPCPTLAEIESAIGFPVRSHSAPVDGCMYELTGQYEGVFVTLMYQPATRADDVFADIGRRVKANGADAQPDRLAVGETGWEYGTLGRKEAAAVSAGRLYHVEIDYNLFDDLKLPDDAAVRVIELAMRTAPASVASSAATAAIDACALATNAELSEIAEVKPELARYWSAPVASHGGSHCDYDGGSIRVYKGASPAAELERTLQTFKADREPRRAISGLGNDAFFMVPYPNDAYRRVGLLAVHQGPRVVQLTLDANGDEPIEATRPRLERLARLVLPRLAATQEQ